MRFSGIACDECGTQKKETNHWFAGFFWAVGVGISIRPFTETEPDTSKFLCGENCVLSFVSKSLREISNVKITG